MGSLCGQPDPNSPSRNNPNDPKSPDAISKGGTPAQLAAQAAAAAVQARQNNAVKTATDQQTVDLKRQRQAALLHNGMGATTLTNGTPLGADYQGKTLLGG